MPRRLRRRSPRPHPRHALTRPKAFHVTAPGALELRDLAMPAPGPGEIVLGVRAALTCGTDLKLFRRGHPKMPFPTRMGHEFAGVVLAAGPGARFKEGDEVMSVHTAPCGACGLCRRGNEKLCPEAMASMTLGGFADALLLPRPVVEVNAFSKPAHLPFEHAAFLEPLSCVVQGLEKVDVREGESVVILGAGPIGLREQVLVKARRAGKVIMVERRQARLAAPRARRRHIASGRLDTASASAPSRPPRPGLGCSVFSTRGGVGWRREGEGA